MASLWYHNGAMDLGAYVETVHHHLMVAAEASGDEARAVAERLTAAVDSTVRLALQDALVTAAEEITCELAPGSVELRLRGRDAEFVVHSREVPESRLPRRRAKPTPPRAKRSPPLVLGPPPRPARGVRPGSTCACRTT